MYLEDVEFDVILMCDAIKCPRRTLTLAVWSRHSIISSVAVQEQVNLITQAQHARVRAGLDMNENEDRLKKRGGDEIVSKIFSNFRCVLQSKRNSLD